MFPDLKAFFPTAYREFPIGYQSDSWADEDFIPVHHTGGYSVSIAYSIRDLRRVDVRVFTLSSGIEQLLEEHYGTDFGFIIALFDVNAGVEHHPLGYIHDLNGAGGTKLFIPTRHEHGHENPKFDHDIYACDIDKNILLMIC